MSHDYKLLNTQQLLYWLYIRLLLRQSLTHQLSKVLIEGDFFYNFNLTSVMILILTWLKLGVNSWIFLVSRCYSAAFLCFADDWF